LGGIAFAELYVVLKVLLDSKHMKHMALRGKKVIANNRGAEFYKI